MILKPKATIHWKREPGPRQMRAAVAEAARRRKEAPPAAQRASPIAKGAPHERTA
jgi:hypothetical protein